jgi:molecular chaperone GrpE (heat shock protein)
MFLVLILMGIVLFLNLNILNKEYAMDELAKTLQKYATELQSKADRAQADLEAYDRDTERYRMEREAFSKSMREKALARMRIPVTDKACIALLRAQGVSEEDIEKLTMDDFQRIAERCAKEWGERMRKEMSTS